MAEGLTPTPEELSDGKPESTDSPQDKSKREHSEDQVKAADASQRGITQREIDARKRADEERVAELREKLGALADSEKPGFQTKRGAPAEKTSRTIHRIGIDEHGQEIEWDETLPDSMEDRIAQMPIDDPEAYFTWLKDFHSEEYETILLEAGEAAPMPYDYAGLDSDTVRKAFEAIKAQRRDDPENMRRLLSELSPAQIFWLSEEPNQKLLTRNEEDEESKQRKVDTIGRLAEFEDFREIAQPSETKVRYVHATSSPEAAETIMKTGLNAHEEGLGGVAVRLGADYEANLEDIAMTHRGYKYEVVVALPKQTERIINETREVYYPGEGRLSIDRLYAEELEKKVEMHGAGLDYSHHIPAEFIEGYLDQTNGSFVRNPHYWENALRREQRQNNWSEEEFAEARAEKLVEFEQRALERVNKLKTEIEELRKKQFFRSGPGSTPPPMPSPTKEETDPNVW